MNKPILSLLFSVGFSLVGCPVAFADFVVPEVPATHVLDLAGILSEKVELQIQNELQALDDETSTQMVVVTLLDLQGYEPEQAALAIGRSWGVGQESLDNGVVFLIVPSERVARIEVGYGLEGAITDAQSYQILEHSVLPSFKGGDYDQGVLNGVAALEVLARGESFDLFLRENSQSFDLHEYMTPQQVLIWGSLFVWFFFCKIFQSKSIWANGVLAGVAGIGMVGFGDVLYGFFVGFMGMIFLHYFLRRNGLLDRFSMWLVKNLPEGSGRWRGSFGRGGGGSHSGGSGSSGGGGFHGGGGGFHGGGGSFGGGGASGRW